MEHKNCRSLLSELSDYIDGELEGSLCAELENHLAGCDNCRVVVDTLKKTVSLYQVTNSDESAPDGVHQRLLQRLDLDAFRGKS